MIVGSKQKLGKIDGETYIKLRDIRIKNSRIDMISTKVSKRIGVIRRMKAFVPLSTPISVHNSIILPHIGYCSCLVWNIGNAYSLERLQKLPNRRAAMVITGKSYYVRSKDLMVA